CPWRSVGSGRPLNELRITRRAYLVETVDSIGRFFAAAGKENPRVASVLHFALLCILEAISYTRKDGQYLRWDYRSGRRQGSKIFNKGEILLFGRAITEKLREIVVDLRAAALPEDLFFKARSRAGIVLRAGSCLELLPKLET